MRTPSPASDEPLPAFSQSDPPRPAPGPAPRVSVVVPLFNCLPLTQAMLASLRVTMPASLPHEVILVDDGSTDGTREWLRTLAAPVRVILNEHNLGYAAANNRGAALARGPDLLLLNNDLVLRPGWLPPMLSAQAALGARAGLVGNVQHTVATGAIDHTGILVTAKGKPTHDRHRPLRAWLPGRLAIRRVPAVTGACVLVRRDLFLSVGGFAEQFVNGCEDVDLAFRLEALGRINVVALRSVVAHHVSASPGRKRRDELNTYRLVQAWRDRLVHHGARAWAWDHLLHLWSAPRDPAGWHRAARLLAFACRLRRTPPPEAVDGLNRAIDRENERWRAMFPPGTAEGTEET